MIVIRFYRDSEDLCWYADLPNYIASKSECQMVDGADTWLDIISNYKESIKLTITDERSKAIGYSIISKVSESDDGATYITDSLHKLFLCNVTKIVLGYFPNKIYYKQIK